MNIAQEIDRLLTSHAPAGYCDACIAELLALPNIQQAAWRTEALAATPYFRRIEGKCARCANQRTIIYTPPGSRGQKHPTDAIGKAVKAMRGSVEAEQERLEPHDGKDPAARALGAKGGKKRAENMTPERRAEIARKAAEKRWRKP